MKLLRVLPSLRTVKTSTKRYLVSGLILLALGGGLIGAAMLTNDGKKTASNLANQNPGPSQAGTDVSATAGNQTEQPNDDTSTSTSAAQAANPQTTTTPKPTSSTQNPTYKGYTPPTISPKPPQTVKPSFRLILSAPAAGSGNSHGFMITIIPDAGSENVHYTTPVLATAPSGTPCNGSIFNVNNSAHNWGWSCNPFMKPDGSMPYGEYSVSFSVTGTSGYGESTTRSISGTIVYHEGQTAYENRY